MDKIILNAQNREESGTIASRKLRQSGLIPAVVYKHGHKTIGVQIKDTDLVHALHTSAGENAIITLKFSSSSKTDSHPGAKTVIIKEIQYHPTKENILHVDFQEISLTEKIKVNVQIVLRGEAVGVKTDGGVLEQMTKELEIECLPTQIPEKIEHNVDEMKIGDTVHVKELEIPSGIEVLTDIEQAVVSVAAPVVEEEPEAVEEAAEGEAQEPEVISEKKAEERQAEAAAGEGDNKEKKEQPQQKEGKEKQ